MTDACAAFAAEASDGGDGLLNVFVPHATAGVIVMELGAGSEQDVLDALDRLLPRDDRLGSPPWLSGHGADHALPLVVSPSVEHPGPAPAGWHWAHGSRSRSLDPTPTTTLRTVSLSFLAG